MEELNRQEEKKLEKGIIYANRKALLKELQVLENNLPPIELKSTSQWLRKYWKHLLFIIIICSLAIAMILYTAHEKTKRIPVALFEEYFEPYPYEGIDKGASQNNLKDKAFTAYGFEDYLEAAKLFTQHDEENKDIESAFYAGVSYLAHQKPKEAIESLIKIPVENQYYVASREYLGLAYFLMKDEDNLNSLIETLNVGEEKDMLLLLSNTLNK